MRLGSYSLLVLALAAPGFAATLTVTNTDDSGAGSLRDVLASANSGDTINFNLTYPATITLSSGPLTVNTNVTINGPGASSVAISGNATFQVFEISGGVQATISGLTIEDALAPYCAYGGGIVNGGTLTVSDSVFTGNAVGYSDCTAPGGGAIVNWGTLTVNNSTFTGNSAYRWGGAINNESIASIANSTFAGNTGLDGAAFFNHGNLTVTGSTFYQNSAGCGGGGGGVIENSAGTATFVNSTMALNSACLGGAIAGYGGSVMLDFTTLSGNSANYSGGSLYGGGITIKNSILANSPLAGNCFVSSSTSGGFNLSDDDSCTALLTATGDVNGVSAGLDPNGLQSDGGPTQTIALLQASPAVDAIPLSYCTDFNGDPVTSDQRGVTRPQGAACDIGAFELVPVYTAPSSGSTCNGTYDGTFTGNLTVTAGQSCKFISGGVSGNVKLDGGTLSLARASVGGNVQITGASGFTLGPGTSISGDLEIHNMASETGQNQICGVDVGGNLEFHNNPAAVVIGDPTTCAGNTVTGNLDVHNNSAPVQVSGNTVGQNLQCQNNTAISGSGNTASAKQGQCASF